MSSVRSPLTPFVDALPLPPRVLIHRDLPESRVWAYGGTVPGPTIEAERGEPVRVQWRNELEGTLPLAVTLAPTETDADGVPVQCLPGLSGGARAAAAASLPGVSVVHLHGGLTAAPYDGWAENIVAHGQHAIASPDSDDLDGARRRAVALVEQELDDAPNMLTMRELAPAPDGEGTPDDGPLQAVAALVAYSACMSASTTRSTRSRGRSSELRSGRSRRRC